MKCKEPKYRTLYETLRNQIVSGSIPYGHKLPSKRALAEEYGLGLITVEHSLELLTWEGYIVSRERSGYFADYRPGEVLLSGKTSSAEDSAEAISVSKTAEDRVIPPMSFAVISKAMRKVLLDRNDAILEKSPNEGLHCLRRAIADYLFRNRGMAVDPGNVWIGSGAEYLYGLIVEAVGQGKVFGVEDPSYEKIRKVYERKGVRIEKLSLGADGIRTRALHASRADILHVSPFRSFPSGVTASASKKQEYVNWVRAGERLLIEDDFESEFSLLRKPEDTVYGLSGGEKVLYLNTFSKTVSPAFRAGYLVVPDAMAEVFREKVGFYSCTVPAFEQYVLTELLESGAFERHVNRIRRTLRKAGES